MSDAVSISSAFTGALADAEGIRAFLAEQVVPLKAEEAALAKPWRPGFRVQLPFYQLLDERQQGHLRGLFGHLLPDGDVALEGYDREELILLDVLSETYVSQAQVFLDLMEQHEYRVSQSVRRDAPGRVIAMTLSASVFVFDAPDDKGRREFHYHNIYGNRHVQPDGRCRLKGHLRLSQSLRTAEFRSSPMLMLAVHPDGLDYRMGFHHESLILTNTLSSQLHAAASEAREQFQEYTGLQPIPGPPAEELGGDGEDEGDEPDKPPRHDTGL